ncbi:MAG: radical SAM family heme chaperone HemW, partial [Prevotella sp.]
MSGLYIHVPFCASRCIYCGFYSTTRLDMRSLYVDALCHEIDLRHDDIKSPKTIYIGGGTPSVLSGDMLDKLFCHIDYNKAVEITMECNPDDITDDFVAILKHLPINRISLGVQTFNDQRLFFLRRRHKAAAIKPAIKKFRDIGIANISIDLMFGFPEQGIIDWENDISKAIELNVEHISAYSLMFEEGSPLFKMLKKAEVKEIDEETSRNMYELLIKRLTEAGYEHYEISNFAKPGYRSV